jgi:transcriptional regulator GlxA family with amidase domain
MPIDNAHRMLASVALQAFPCTVDRMSPLAADSPAVLRQAIAYLDDNAHRAVGLSDVAAAVHTSPRNLQYLFRRHLDTTPSLYLRQVRLDAAHRELRLCTPDETTVRAVARSWGFGNYGRFTRAYRLAYGRSPIATLRD